MNLGCGYDIKKGWTNVDQETKLMIEHYGEVEGWNCLMPPPDFYWNKFDFVLINHLFCTMKPNDAAKVLENVKMVLKEGGRIQVIDMNLLKAFEAYKSNQPDLLPIQGGDIDYKLCMHISGYGTRLSLYTPELLKTMLGNLGYRYAVALQESEYDLRPMESVIVEAVK